MFVCRGGIEDVVFYHYRIQYKNTTLKYGFDILFKFTCFIHKILMQIIFKKNILIIQVFRWFAEVRNPPTIIILTWNLQTWESIG